MHRITTPPAPHQPPQSAVLISCPLDELRAIAGKADRQQLITAHRWCDQNLEIRSAAKRREILAATLRELAGKALA